MSSIKNQVQHVINTTCDVIANIYCLAPYNDNLKSCLETIQSDNDKLVEFNRLTGFSPNVVLKLQPYCPGLTILDLKIARFKSGVENPSNSVVRIAQ